MRIPSVLLGLYAALLLALPGDLGCGQPPADREPRGEVQLPPPATQGAMSVEETMAKRRSIRSYRPDPLTLEQIGQLLWAAQGITLPERGLRTAPSAGAIYPLRVYAATPEGLFRYLPQGHRLAQLSSEDVRDALSRACFGQQFVAQAPVSIIFAADYEVIRARYRDRAEMFTHIEVGHAAQNVHLQAVALGLGSVPVGAFTEAEVSAVIGAPANETVVYVVPVGHPAS